MNNLDVCGLCVLSVSRSAATHVLLEVRTKTDLASMRIAEVTLHPGEIRDVSSYFAARPEAIIRLANGITRGELVTLAINRINCGLWPDLVFAGTPICSQHIWLADDTWGQSSWTLPNQRGRWR